MIAVLYLICVSTLVASKLTHVIPASLAYFAEAIFMSGWCLSSRDVYSAYAGTWAVITVRLLTITGNVAEDHDCILALATDYVAFWFLLTGVQRESLTLRRRFTLEVAGFRQVMFIVVALYAFVVVAGGGNYAQVYSVVVLGASIVVYICRSDAEVKSSDAFAVIFAAAICVNLCVAMLMCGSRSEYADYAVWAARLLISMAPLMCMRVSGEVAV